MTMTPEEIKAFAQENKRQAVLFEQAKRDMAAVVKRNDKCELSELEFNTLKQDLLDRGDAFLAFVQKRDALPEEDRKAIVLEGHKIHFRAELDSVFRQINEQRKSNGSGNKDELNNLEDLTQRMNKRLEEATSVEEINAIGKDSRSELEKDLSTKCMFRTLDAVSAVKKFFKKGE